MKKKIFVILLSLILVASLIPAIVIPIVLKKPPIMLSADSNNHGWDIAALEKKIKDKDTFIAYYGRKSCLACTRMTKIIKENQTLKNAFSKFEKKHDVDDALHWFYNENKDKDKEQEQFQTKLNKIVTENGFSKIKYTPTWLYFKKGKLVKKEIPLIVGSDNPAKDGDTVKIDYVGKIDGKIFEGGSRKGHKLKLGSKSFINGFESGLLGTRSGEEKTLKLQFPQNYPDGDLAKKKVEFKVKIHKVMKNLNPSPQQIAQRLADVITNDDNW